jgi:t-SNARE complex subunit (syntaxin)
MRVSELRTSAEATKLQLEIANLANFTSTSRNEQHASHLKTLVAILYERLHASLARIQKSENSRLQAELAQRKHFNQAPTSYESQKEEPSSAQYDPECELLLAAYSSDLDQVRALQRRLAETSGVLDILTAKVAEQHELSQSILATAEDSTAAVEAAAAQLKKASNNQSGFRFYVTCWFISSACLLLILDVIF